MKKLSIRNTDKYALVDDDVFETLSKYKWYLRNGKYAVRHTYGKNNKMVLLHREIMKIDNDLQIDHINGDGLDNRKVNLRACSVSENGFNRGKAKHNTSGFKGVFRNKRKKKGESWLAQITIKKQQIYLGFFNRKEDAAKAYNMAALKYQGSFAQLNKV